MKQKIERTLKARPDAMTIRPAEPLLEQGYLPVTEMILTFHEPYFPLIDVVFDNG